MGVPIFSFEYYGRSSKVSRYFSPDPVDPLSSSAADDLDDAF